MSIWQSVSQFFNGKKEIQNKFNETFFYGLNGFTNNDDTNLTKYINDGYNINGDVFSIINQKSSKLVSIPYYIKDIKDDANYKKANRLLKAVNYNPNITQKLRLAEYETKGLTDSEYPMPFDKPNPNQDWNEFFKLSETFLDLTGNVYWYKQKPENGLNAGEPIALYLLPSNYVKIHVKKDISITTNDDPIDYFELDMYNQLVRFERDEVVHISIDNPNYGLNGEQLYGQSRLRAVWSNVLSINKAKELNLEMLRNAGVFGFIHGKSHDFNPEKAQSLKDALNRARNSKDDLANIMGASQELGFTRISLTTDELKTFEHLKYDQKQICNALGWSDTLLNNDDGGKYDKQISELKRVLTNSIVPDAKIIERAFNEGVLSEIKAYKGKALIFDYKELPEMQDDLATLSEWVGVNVDRGIINRTTARHILRLPEDNEPLLDQYTVKNDVMTLEQAMMPNDDINL